MESAKEQQQQLSVIIVGAGGIPRRLPALVEEACLPIVQASPAS